MLSLRNGERTLLANNTTLMEFQELSDLNNGRTMPWKSNPTVVQPTYDSHQALIQDGGNSSRKMEPSLLMKKER
jgi:hypothetical protein